MIDVNREELISLATAAKLLPRRRAGKKPHVSCLYRWTQCGCRGVRLESLQVGGTRCTSKEALARFFERLSARAVGVADAPVTSRRDHIGNRAEAAARELEKLGV